MLDRGQHLPLLRVQPAPGFVAAIRDGYFRVVAYNGAVTPGVDAAVARALQTSGSYRLAKIVLFAGAFAHAPYYIWVKR